MHVAEQPKEVEASVTEYGRRPAELLADLGLLDERFTAVHAVHVLPSEIALLSRSTVCACPTTERDLGDGILPADAMVAAGVTLAIGSDSQTLLEPFEDLRALESHLRLIRGRRVVLPSIPGEVDSLAATLLGAATTGGARSLGLDVGTLAPGRPADLCAVNLDHPSLAGTREDAVLATVIFGATSATVSDTWVQGTRVVREGRHPLEETSGKAFEALSRRMFA
jgi:formimidoylglutamate deiminase